MTVSFDSRIQVLNAAFDCLKALGKSATPKLTNDLAIAFLTLLISKKDEAPVPHAITEEFKTVRFSKSKTVMSFIALNAAKIESAT